MFLDPFAQDRQVPLNHANAMAQHSWSFSWSEPSENTRYIYMCRFVYITSWPFTDAAFKSFNPNVLTPRAHSSCLVRVKIYFALGDLT